MPNKNFDMKTARKLINEYDICLFDYYLLTIIIVMQRELIY